MIKVIILTVDSLFQLLQANSKQLERSRQEFLYRRQVTEIAKSERLPEVAAGANIGYFSNIAILNPDYSYSNTVHSPHVDNNYSVDAQETLFSGGYKQERIRKAELSEQLAQLDIQRNEQEIKLLLLGEYLHLFQLHNELSIYRLNIELAERRLSDIRHLRAEGLLTSNDSIRSALLIADLSLGLEEAENETSVVNRELCVVLGLPAQTMISPDTAVIDQTLQTLPLDDYFAAAKGQPLLKEAMIREKMSARNIAIANAAKFPTVSLYAGDALQRPFLFTPNPINIYFAAYQVGISLKYDISSIYHAKEHVQLARIELAQKRVETADQEQKTEIAVYTAFIKLKEARAHVQTLRLSKSLAIDNYRIVEEKYVNQLAQITDVLDASTARLAADLRLNNARVDVAYEWYRLQQAVGVL
jgi:outer membrane protein